MIAVVTDSTTSLPKEAAEQYGIRVLPVYIMCEGKTYRDGLDITNDEVYRLLIEEKKLITTSSPSGGTTSIHNRPSATPRSA